MTIKLLAGKLALYCIRERQRIKYSLKRKCWSQAKQWLAYLESDRTESGLTLVFLHGLGASKDQWGAAVYQLAQEYHCLFLDLPGEGESSFDPHEDYSPSAQVDRLHDFFEDKGVTSFALIGSSVGGCIAALYASQHPRSVAKLITMAPAGIPSPSMGYEMQHFVKTREHPFGYRSVAEMRYLWRLVFYREPKVPHFLELALAHKGRARHHRVEKIISDFYQAGLFPLTTALKDIRSNTLVIWGECDRIFDVSCTEFVAEVMPDAEISIFQAAGHVPYLEKGGQIVDRLKTFLK